MNDMELKNRSKGASEPSVQEAPVKHEGDSTVGGRGSAPGLLRYIRYPPVIMFEAILQLSWISLGVSFQAGLLNGGPIALVYGPILAWIGSSCIAASLAEMASITPTVGAQYRWTGLYSPPGWGPPAFWSILQGWITVFAWLANTASPAFLIGTQIQGLIILNDPSYTPTKWQGVVLAWAVLVIPVIANLYTTKLLEILEVIGIILNVCFYITVVVVLAVMAPRSPASFVFETSIFDLSGWSSPGVMWCVGLLPPVYALSAFDGVLHMSDEVKDAPRKVPWSMVIAVAADGLTSYLFIITVLFCLGDLNEALTTPTGYAIIQVFYSATGSKAAATAMMSTLIFIGLISLFNGLASVKRLTWVFAKDHGLPFENFLGYVHPTLRIPTNTLFVVTVVMALVQLLNLASTAALEAVLSLSSLALYFSYIMPTLFFLLRRLRGEPVIPAPFQLGRWGIPINIFAVLYGTFISIWLPFPSFQPVTWGNMNYCGPVLGAVIVFALCDWFISGHKRFAVPTSRHDLY